MGSRPRRPNERRDRLRAGGHRERAGVAWAPAYNEFLLPAIRFCLEQAGLGFRNLGGIAVSLGPGLYTGMRVGVATAKALAQALSVPIVGMASLDLLAYEVRYSPKTICAVLDARRRRGLPRVLPVLSRRHPADDRVPRRAPEQLAYGITSQPEEVLLW